MLAFFIATLQLAAPAEGAVAQFEVREYMRDFSVSAADARDALATQSRGREADVVGHLEGRLNARYAGLWFDNARGEFVIPVLDERARRLAQDVFVGAGLGDDFRTESAQSSWRQLEVAQDGLDKDLSSALADGAARTSLDPRTNSVVIHQADGVGSGERRMLRSRAAEADVDVELRTSGVKRFRPTPTACSTLMWAACDAPMRGGVGIGEDGIGSKACTAGFNATSPTTGARYVITAGHCARDPDITYWMSSATEAAAHYLGYTEQAQWGNGRDLAKINATGTSYWGASSWPSWVVVWSPEGGTPADPARTIDGEAASFLGQYACHSGIGTGTSCGYVRSLDVTVTFEPGFGKPPIVVEDLSELFPVCNGGTDSGGPVFAGSTALGINSFADDELAECQNYSLYGEIIDATDLLGVNVAPRATQTSIETVPLNGNPGWVTLKGNVHAPYGAPVNNKKVNIKLFKWESNSWVEKATLPADVNNNSYEIANWNGVGPGTWLAKAVFPAQAPFEGSQSNETNEGWFTIKDGYQLVNVYANKCLDVENSGTANGVHLQQWACANPANSPQQVFTLVPKGDSTYQIVARNSNRCLDVINGGQSNGTWIQQWDCGGGQHQLFKGVPIGEGTPWVQFRAQHSGKCLEIGGPSLNNGAKAQQWDCLGFSQGNQLWDFKSVDAGPVQTTTTHVVTQTLNGEPGWVSLGGNVTAGAYAINNVYAYHYFYKKIGGVWTYTGATHSVVQNNHFAVNNYPVGAGEWVVTTVFPQQGALGASQTGQTPFEIRKGYQLVNVYSGKCLDVEGGAGWNGVNLQQWDCYDPATHKNQVFTLEPRGDSYYHIVAKHSNRCVDLSNGSYNNGTWVQQWDCYGDEFFHQIWKGVPIGYGTPWVQFRAKHSDKCLEIGGPSLNNGAKAQQWDCLGFSQGNQLWDFRSVTW